MKLFNYLVLRAPDANQAGGSSSSADGEGESSSQDGNSDSSQSEESSNSSENSGAAKTLADVVKATFAKSTKSQAGSESQENEDNNQNENENDGQENDENEENEDDSEDQNEEGQENEETETDDESQDEESEDSENEDTEESDEDESDESESNEQSRKPVPYKRFAQVNQKRNELEAELTRVKPELDDYRGITNFLQENDISADDYGFWMRVAAAHKNSPKDALKLLSPVFDELRGLEGEVLPPDLQAAVDKEEITLEYAKRIVAAETQKKLEAKQNARQQEKMEKQRERQYQLQVHTAMSNWYKQKMTSDAGFRKVGEGKPDGKYEYFCAKYDQAASKAQLETVQAYIDLAEKVYAQVNANPLFKRGVVNSKSKSNSQQNTNGQRRLGATGGRINSSNGSAAPSKTQPKSLQDVARNVARSHGYRV